MRHFIFLSTMITAMFFSSGVFAGIATARLDGECHFHNASFTVPEGKQAVNLNMQLDSSWLVCAGAGHASRIGGRLIGPTGAVLYYAIQTYEGSFQILAGNLSGLTLGPGKYTVEVRDGGKGTSASVGYELIDTAPLPTPTTAPAGKGSSLTGEWTDPSVKSSMRIVQAGGNISVTNTFNWEGKTVTWTGTGTVSGDKVRINYSYTGYRPEGWENGSMSLTRTNKKTLSGSWTTSSGKFSQPITFVKLSSDDPEIKPAKIPAPQKPKIKGPVAPPAVSHPAPKPKQIVCPPGQIYEENVGCTRYLRQKEER